MPLWGDDAFLSLNDFRWVLEHHAIPQADNFSYTRAGSRWIYPLGAGAVFYALWWLGGYALLSLASPAGSALVAALLLRRNSIASAVFTGLAVAAIAYRCRVRADLFSVLFSAVFLRILWRYHETGRARLWLLPTSMIVWANTHLGFIAAFALIAGYVVLEALELPFAERRSVALIRLRRAWPWLARCAPASLVNPFGRRLYLGVLDQLGVRPRYEILWGGVKPPIGQMTLSGAGGFAAGPIRALAAVLGVGTKDIRVRDCPSKGNPIDAWPPKLPFQGRGPNVSEGWRADIRCELRAKAPSLEEVTKLRR